MINSGALNLTGGHVEGLTDIAEPVGLLFAV